MDWRAVISSFVGAIGGSVALFKILGDRLLERQKFHYSREMAEIAHQRSILLAEMQNAFSMGANSHMANTAFDNLVEFCEEYYKAVSEALNARAQNRRMEEALEARRLSDIRQKWALWLTEKMESKLAEFERKISLMDGARDFAAYGEPPTSREGIIKIVIEDLKKVLHTEELTALRNELVIRSSTKPHRDERLSNS